MDGAFSQPVVCPVMVGRAAYLSALTDVLAAARRGAGRTVLVAGEAGIGKSRLVAELREVAAQQGFGVLHGACFEADRLLPYAPLLDLLRGFSTARSPEQLADELGPYAGELVKLVPELSLRLPEVTPTPPLDPEAEKRRLFAALEQVLVRLAARQSRLVIVEDIHWSDDVSLEFFRYLAHRLGRQPLLMVMTYRSDEVHAGLAHALADLDRARLAVEVRLTPLTVGEVEAMLRATLGLARPVRPDFVATIASLTEGNPFFIEEVLRGLETSGEPDSMEAPDRRPLRLAQPPRTVQDTVRRRAQQVSPAARQALTLAAVAGRRFDFALLQAVLELDETTVLALIKELIAAQFVVEETADQFAFRHDLMRQAIYADLLARERQALHLAVAEALERRGAGEAEPADLAQHYYAAAAWPKAYEYALRAGKHAATLYAPRAAIDHLTHALTAADRLQRRPLPAVYRERGLAHEWLGDFEAARTDHEQALRLARAAEDDHAEWQALLDLGLLWSGRDYAQAGIYCQEALRRARAIDEPALIARSLNRVGNWHANVERPQAALDCHQEALTIFEALGDRRGQAETLDLLGVASYLAGDLVQSAASFERAVALFRALDDRQHLSASLVNLALCHSSYETPVPAAAQLADPVGLAEEGLRLARAIGWRAGEAFAAGQLAELLGTLGDYGRALRLARESLTIAEEIQHRQWLTAAHYALGVLHYDLLAPAAAIEHLEQGLALAEAIRSEFWISMMRAYLALAFVDAQEHGRAAALLETPATVETLGQMLSWYARAELALAEGHAAQALALIDRLMARSTDGGERRAQPRLTFVRGRALVELRRLGEAEAALVAARDGAEACGMMPLWWRAQAMLGALYQVLGRTDEAEAAFAATVTTIERLAEPLDDEALRDQFLRRATAWLPRSFRRPARQPARPSAPGGLTAREADVAGLLARGLSNRAMAEALSVSERTVEGHVSSILSKLGFSSRAQVAAWAVEHGLLTTID